MSETVRQLCTNHPSPSNTYEGANKWRRLVITRCLQDKASLDGRSDLPHRGGRVFLFEKQHLLHSWFQTWPQLASKLAVIGRVGLTIGGITIGKVLFGQQLQKNVRIALHNRCETFDNKCELLDRNVRNAFHNMCTEYLPESPLKVNREQCLSASSNAWWRLPVTRPGWGGLAWPVQRSLLEKRKGRGFFFRGNFLSGNYSTLTGGFDW